MTMNSSGPISLAGVTAGVSIEIENGGNGTTQISLNDTAVRTLAGVPSGAITMPTNFYGKSNRAVLSVTYSANTAAATLNLSTISGYVSGKSDITITINSGVYLYATSTSGYGLSLSGGASGDTLTIVNNGFILGMGGRGGFTSGPNANVGAGGPALNLSYPATINNTNGSAYIAGGGGGGGGASQGAGGGGAGGGQGGNTGGGAGGGPGSTGSAGVGRIGGADPDVPSYMSGDGGGGGRILPGSGGSGGSPTFSSPPPNGGQGGGAGGGGGAGTFVGGGSGGSGTSGGSGGGQSSPGFTGGGGGGGWAASGGPAGSGFGGQGGGKAVNTNGNTVTWTSGNTTRVYGSVS